MAKKRVVYELSEKDTVEIFRLWIEDASKNPLGRAHPSATVNAAVFITYADKLGA